MSAVPPTTRPSLGTPALALLAAAALMALLVGWQGWRMHDVLQAVAIEASPAAQPAEPGTTRPVAGRALASWRREAVWQGVIGGGSALALGLLAFGVERQRRRVTVADPSLLRQAEAEAREANRWLLAAEEVAHVGHWRLDLRSGGFIWSAEVFRIHGLAPDGAVPSVEEAIAFYHPDDRATVAKHVENAILAARPYEFKLRLVRDDGDIRNVLARGFCETDSESGQVVALFGVFQDITDMARAERELSRKSAQLEATLGNMDQGLVKVSADGRVEMVNDRFCELLDVPPSVLAVKGCRFADVLALCATRGDVLRRASGAVIGSAEAASLHAEVYERHRPDGLVLETATVLLPDGSMVRTYTDITARRTAEQAMRDSETRYRMLAETTSDLIVQISPDLTRDYVSPASRTLLGKAPEALIGQSPEGHMHPEDAPVVMARLRSLFEGTVTGDGSRSTYRVRHEDGRWIWVDASASLLRDTLTGEPRTVICSLRDVTERQRAARHLERAKAAAETAARQQSDFMANMSHELRTPLTGILGLHDILRRDPALGPEQRRYLDMAHDAGRALLGIINDVLDYSKIEAGHLSTERAPFRLDAVLQACTDFVGEGARQKGLDFVVETTGTAVDLAGDAGRLRQILLNLLTNAVKFTAEGRVTLRAAYDAEASRLRVEVADTGIGIAAEAVPALFDRFSQADASTTRRFGGTGLGLAISKRLLDLMGGRIGVHSAAGCGSTFWFELDLPAVARLEGAPSVAVAATHPAMMGSTLRILLAEDNALNQEIISAMLTHRGHRVSVVDNGAAAVSAAVGDVDVILMDVQMPVMDGLAATRAIREAAALEGRRCPPIIGLTANALLEDVAQCLAVGMSAHVAKPIQWPELFAAIEQSRERSPDVSEAPAGLPVLDTGTLDALESVIGGPALSALLRRFVKDLEARLGGLEDATATDLAAQCHSWTSSAGQLGFTELAASCAALEAELRETRVSGPIEPLRRAATRALQAGQQRSAAGAT